MPNPEDILRLLKRLVRSDARLSLAAVARTSGWSAHHLHRDFRAVAGETPRGYQLRLRLERSLVLLATDDAPIHEVADRAGFAAHATFTRSFRAAFGCTPSAFRARTRGRWTPSEATTMAETSRCVRLFGLPLSRRTSSMPIDIRIETRDAQPILFTRRRVAPSELAATFAACLPRVFAHCQAHGHALAGAPFARYPDVGRGLVTVECGMPVIAAAPGVDDIEPGELTGGRVAVAIHAGPYEMLHETHAAVERWLEEQGLAAGGPPWESYVTDPADHPDPADWKTEVCWPVA